jgi:adenine-specific DNA-methyltransferase
MRYIGSKLKLVGFIKDTVHNVCGYDLRDKVFCDLFAGTGIVGRAFKRDVKHVISNDLEYYAYVLNRNYIGNSWYLADSIPVLDHLNGLKGVEGFMYKNYCAGSGSGRMYFSDENGKRIDAIRQEISDRYSVGDEDMYYFLLASLIESADKYANNTSVYCAYLKKLKQEAAQCMQVEGAWFEDTKQDNEVYHNDAAWLIDTCQGDILYMDPPYTDRNYSDYYHILNTIAKYDNPEIYGVAGLRINRDKSAWCSKKLVLGELRRIIHSASFKYIFMSYSSDGILSCEDIERVMKVYGQYDRVALDYSRYKADTDSNRSIRGGQVKEYIHVLEKE